MEIPTWVDVVKTAPYKELCPTSPDWYYIRAASVARQIYLKPHIGVGALATYFGGNYRRGARTEHFRKASSGLLRHILQQLEKIGVVAIDGKGRIVTPNGQQDLDLIAGNVKEKDIEEAEAADEDDDDEDDDDDESEEESEESEDSEEDSD